MLINIPSQNPFTRPYKRSIAPKAHVSKNLPLTALKRGSNKPFQTRVYRLMGNDKFTKGENYLPLFQRGIEGDLVLGHVSESKLLNALRSNLLMRTLPQALLPGWYHV